jgi:hypothetical protein
MKLLIRVVVIAVDIGTEQFWNASRKSYRVSQLVQNTLNTFLSKSNLWNTTSLIGLRAPTLRIKEFTGLVMAVYLVW